MKFKRLSEREKHSDDNNWFKEHIRDIDTMSVGFNNNLQWKTRYDKLKINYNLYNGNINESDFIDIIYPYGQEAGKLPANFTNKNIIFPKIRVLEGMEIVRPFFYRIIAVNPEATTRKEQKKFNMMRDWVTNEIMTTVKQEISTQFQPQIDQLNKQVEEAQKNNQSTDSFQEVYKQIQEQMNQEIEAKTPDEVNTYMQRDYQDPAEVLGNQILTYNMALQDFKDLFIRGVGHAAKAGIEIFWVGEENEKPTLRIVHPLGFSFGKSSRSHFIQDGDWAAYVWYMRPNELAIMFGDELSNEEFNHLLEGYDEQVLTFSEVNVVDEDINYNYPTQGIRVVHTEWKAVKSVGILTYQDEEGEIQKRLVNSDYTIDEEIGDISIEKVWIPTKYEGYKLGADTFVRMREVPGQHQDLSKLYDCKLSYIGAIFDSGKSMVERMKGYQYLYDVLMYRMEIKISQDKGKKMLIDQDLIDEELGTAKWLLSLDKLNIGFTSRSKEGDKNLTNVSQQVKEMDFSLVTDIDKYRSWAEYIKEQCGESIGIPETLSGQIEERDAVRNVQQAITNSTTILQPFFSLHDRIKRDVLQQFVECAKTVYCKYRPEYLSYVLDDLSEFMIKMDYDILDNSSYGLFVTDSNQTFNIMQQINPLLMGAAQSGKISMGEIINVLKAQSLTEAEEALQKSERGQQKVEQALQMQKAQLDQQTTQMKSQSDKELEAIKHQYTLEEIKAKGEIELAKAQIEYEKQIILAAGFDTDKDRNNNNVADIVEIAQKGRKEAAEIILKAKKQSLDEEKFEHQKETDEKKLALEARKLNNKST